MVETMKNIEKIKRNILKLPSDRLQELEKFIESLLSKSSQKTEGNVKNLEGIWEGIGFEKIDIEKELSKIRSEIETSMNGNIV